MDTRDAAIVMTKFPNMIRQRFVYFIDYDGKIFLLLICYQILFCRLNFSAPIIYINPGFSANQLPSFNIYWDAHRQLIVSHGHI